MKRYILSIIISVSFALQALAHDFQSGNLLYSIIGTDPPCVSLDGHIDGTEAQGELVIPETVTHEGVSYDVTAIRQFAFYNCKGLTSLALGQRIETIGRQCFEKCSGICGDLIIPNSVTEIEANAFYDCSGLDGSLVISENISVINTNVFRNCGFTCNLVIPERVTVIKTAAFCACEGFYGNLVIPDAVSLIDDMAFESCTGFDGELVIGESVQFIGGFAFAYCSGFTGNLTIPNSVTTVSDCAFEACSGFDGSLMLSSKLISIGRCAFKDCGRLSGDLVIPDGVIEIGWAAFENCSGLSGYLEIPDTVQRIERKTFNNCSFSCISLGESLQEIHDWAFKNVSSLQAMTIKAIIPPTFVETEVHTAFENVPKEIPVRVPCGSLDAYRNAEGWSEFINMFEGVTNTLTLLSSNETAGAVSILKEATCEDMSVEVLALPNDGFEFFYWEAKGEMVSTNNPFHFVLDEDTQLIAYFKGAGAEELMTFYLAYPNPAQDRLHLQYSPDVQPKQVDLYDLQGRPVRSQSQGLESLNMQGLAPGQYLMKVTLEDGKSFTDKVVKE